MSSPLLLAVDQGTTNTKAVAIETAHGAPGSTVAHHSERVSVSFPRPGWVESDPAELWRSTVSSLAAVARVLDGREPAALGISNQRETVVAWNRRTGEPLGPAPSWQCTRGADLVRSLDSPGARDLVTSRTGLALDPMFSAPKMRWLLDHAPSATRLAEGGDLALGTVDAWLAFNLTGGTDGGLFVTDLTNASRTALVDLATGDWDDELLALFGLPRSTLPDIVASSEVIGPIACPELLGLAGVPLAALAGDSHAAMVGHGVLGRGHIKATFGTGSSVMAPSVPGASAAGVSRTIGWSAARPQGRLVVPALEGNIYATGAALEWTADLLGLGGDVAALESLARSCDDSAGVSLVPAFSGLGAPHWAPDARGTIGGLTRGAGRAELARAAFEAVGHQIADVLDAIASALEVAPTVLHADGGAMRSPLLAATVADLTGLTVERAEHPEVGALGAALLAGLAVGIWDSPEALGSLPRPTATIAPALDDAGRAHSRSLWASALHRVVS